MGQRLCDGHGLDEGHGLDDGHGVEEGHGLDVEGHGEIVGHGDTVAYVGQGLREGALRDPVDVQNEGLGEVVGAQSVSAVNR